MAKAKDKDDAKGSSAPPSSGGGGSTFIPHEWFDLELKQIWLLAERLLRDLQQTKLRPASDHPSLAEVETVLSARRHQRSGDPRYREEELTAALKATEEKLAAEGARGLTAHGAPSTCARTRWPPPSSRWRPASTRRWPSSFPCCAAAPFAAVSTWRSSPSCCAFSATTASSCSTSSTRSVRCSSTGSSSRCRRRTSSARSCTARFSPRRIWFGC